MERFCPLRSPTSRFPPPSLAVGLSQISIFLPHHHRKSIISLATFGYFIVDSIFGPVHLLFPPSQTLKSDSTPLPVRQVHNGTPSPHIPSFPSSARRAPRVHLGAEHGAPYRRHQAPRRPTPRPVRGRAGLFCAAGVSRCVRGGSICSPVTVSRAHPAPASSPRLCRISVSSSAILPKGFCSPHAP